MLKKDDILQILQDSYYSYEYDTLKDRVKQFLHEKGEDNSDEAVNSAIADQCMNFYNNSTDINMKQSYDEDPQMLLVMIKRASEIYFELPSDRAAAEEATKADEAEDDANGNAFVELLLCFFLGFLGAHKFYRKENGMGVLYLLTGGLFGIGALVDTIKIIVRLCNK